MINKKLVSLDFINLECGSKIRLGYGAPARYKGMQREKQVVSFICIRNVAPKSPVAPASAFGLFIAFETSSFIAFLALSINSL